MRTTCWLCGVKLTEHMREMTDYENLCPECSMEAEEFGIEDDAFDDAEFFI